MIFDPVHFDSTMFETANDAVLFCREYLEKNDNPHVALALLNIDVITNAMTARVALERFQRVRAYVVGRAQREYVDATISTLDRAIAGECAPRSAA